MNFSKSLLKAKVRMFGTLVGDAYSAVYNGLADQACQLIDAAKPEHVERLQKHIDHLSFHLFRAFGHLRNAYKEGEEILQLADEVAHEADLEDSVEKELDPVLERIEDEVPEDPEALIDELPLEELFPTVASEWKSSPADDSVPEEPEMTPAT